MSTDPADGPCAREEAGEDGTGTCGDGQADVVVLVVDARVGVTASDEQIVRMLRRVKKPIILIANKIDDAHLEPEIYNLWSLGMGQPFPVSGLHGRGLADALDEILEVMPEHSQFAQPEALGGPRRVALVVARTWVSRRC